MNINLGLLQRCHCFIINRIHFTSFMTKINNAQIADEDEETDIHFIEFWNLHYIKELGL